MSIRIVLITAVLLIVTLSPLMAQVVYIPPPRVATTAAMSVHTPATGLAPGMVYGPAPVPIVYDIPPECGTAIVNGVIYNTCGGDYYRPYYNGPNIVYAPVAHPQ